MSRGRSYVHNEWDLLNVDFNNSSYDPQYPDDDAGDRVQIDQHRLYVRNIPKALSEEGLRTAFSKYGTLVRVFLSKDPSKRYALVQYETPGEAKLAMIKLNNTDPLKLNVALAHKSKKKDSNPRDSLDRCYTGQGRRTNQDETSISSRGISFRQHEDVYDGEEVEDSQAIVEDDLDPDTKLKGIQLEIERLKVQEQTVLLKKQLLHLETAKKKLAQGAASNRCILPDGRIVVRNTNDRNLESRDVDGGIAAGAGDSNDRGAFCSCKAQVQRSRDHSEGSSTPSTCVLCEDGNTKDRHKAKSVASKYTTISKRSSYSSRFDKTTNLSRKSVASKVTEKSDLSRKSGNKFNAKEKNSDITCDFKYSDFYCDSEVEADETNRLIQLRNSDYMDIVGDSLKVVIALAGYPRSKIRLKQMELFQRCLTDVIDTQLKRGLLNKVPSFHDYYLNRGAIVCICKDKGTRDWMVRVSPGLQERMCSNLILLKARVKRLCLAVLKIPQSCWPATAQDAFKLLQYFNPTLKTDQWKIYAQNCSGNVESTSFIIDRVSGEIIRGPMFKNVIDYEQMEFEITGYAEIYNECLLCDCEEDIGGVVSRVQLLDELRVDQATPKKCSVVSFTNPKRDSVEVVSQNMKETDDFNHSTDAEDKAPETKKDIDNSTQIGILDKLKDVKYVSDKDEMLVWSDETNKFNSDNENEDEEKEEYIGLDENNSGVAASEKTESVIESNDNLISRSGVLNIDSNRGIAYHRRTNYLHVENELKVAITLEGYPQNKLEGTHIRRLKHLFKEYMHKDMKMQRFANLIIPKFQDIYLSNGAVIYICDSLETKDYLTEVMPKFINSTGLKLTFRDILSLVRYTRVVLRLPKEQAHVESVEILLHLKAKYPSLQPDRWKYYSDVAGKQKRQFGVDPESLEVIKSSDFDPIYDGEMLSFRIIDRQKRDVSFESNTKDVNDDDDKESKALRDKVMRLMYVPVDQHITNIPLNRTRIGHYSDLIPDDLKLYVGPHNYPETRVDEALFHSIERTFQNIVCVGFEKRVLDDRDVPKFHDMYLFDGVIFIICKNKYTREWVEDTIGSVNDRLKVHLKATEFRGAVGIVSMIVRSEKDPGEIIIALQKQNPRLRTKYWRIISTVRNKAKLDVVLQIDKLSAQIITSPEFNRSVGGSQVQFKLGHLQSLLKDKCSLEELTKKHVKKQAKYKPHKSDKEKTIEELKYDINMKFPELKIDQWDVISEQGKEKHPIKMCNYEINETSKIVEKVDSSTRPTPREPFVMSPTQSQQGDKKVYLKIPTKLLPNHVDDLYMIFYLLEDKNPGLNTELWKVCGDPKHRDRFSLIVDKRSADIIAGRYFDPVVGGEKLIFLF